jgi:hypothetical protein
MSRDPSRPNVEAVEVKWAPSNDETVVDRLIRLLFTPDNERPGEGKSPGRPKEDEEDASFRAAREAR